MINYSVLAMDFVTIFIIKFKILILIGFIIMFIKIEKYKIEKSNNNR